MASSESNATLKAARKKKSETPVLPCLVEHAGSIPPCVKMVATGEHHSLDCTARNRHNNLSRFARKCWRGRSKREPMNSMIPRCKYGMWLGMRNISAKPEDWNRITDGIRSRDHQQCDCGALEVDTDGRWKLAGQKFMWTQSPSRHCHLREHEFRGKKSQSKTSISSEPLWVSRLQCDEGR